MNTEDGVNVRVAHKPEAENDFVRISTYCIHDRMHHSFYLQPDEAVKLAKRLKKVAKKAAVANRIYHNKGASFDEQRAAIVKAGKGVAPNRPIKNSLELKPCDVILGDWDCSDSPTGQCAYDGLSFNGTDSCLFCCEPLERK